MIIYIIQNDKSGQLDIWQGYMCSCVETNLSWTNHISRLFEFWTSLGTSFLLVNIFQTYEGHSVIFVPGGFLRIDV